MKLLKGDKLIVCILDVKFVKKKIDLVLFIFFFFYFNCLFFLLFYFLVLILLFFILDLGKGCDIILHMTIIQVIKYGRDVMSITVIDHIII